MKKFLVLLLILVLSFSCSSGGDDDGPAPNTNNPPDTPSLVFPSNLQLCIDNNLEFEWSSVSDPDGDTVSYVLEISRNIQFNPIEYTTTQSGVTKNLSLENGISYYWRVKAKDNQNAQSNYSEVYNFYTEGDGIANYLPFAPTLINPVLNSTLEAAEVTLQWDANDLDSEDELVYDVYFGEQNPPTTEVSSGQSEKTFSVNLLSSTQYYWKVIVKDNNGGETVGQIWNFSTE